MRLFVASGCSLEEGQIAACRESIDMTRLTTQGKGCKRLANDAENHSALVDDEFCSAKMVAFGPHVAVLELGPVDFLHVEAPYYRRHDGIVMSIR